MNAHDDHHLASGLALAGRYALVRLHDKVTASLIRALAAGNNDVVVAVNAENNDVSVWPRRDAVTTLQAAGQHAVADLISKPAPPSHLFALVALGHDAAFVFQEAVPAPVECISTNGGEA